MDNQKESRTMREINGTVEIKKEDLAAIDFTKLTAYSIASAGAMGEAGGVSLLMEDGTLYHFNFLESDIQLEDVEPLIEKAGPFVTEYLGFGNYLRFHEEDAGWLLEKRDKYVKTADKNESGGAPHERTVLYKMWVSFFREHITETHSDQKLCEEEE